MVGLLALGLAACGGGGSSGGSPTSPVNNATGNWLTFNPSAPSVTQLEEAEL